MKGWNIDEEEAEEISKGLGVKVDIAKRAPWLTYYFAASPGQIAKNFDGVSANVLISMVHCVKRTGKREVRLPTEVERFIDENPDSKIMLDSGGFTNFTKPGTVLKEEHFGFLDEHGDKFSEYVMFDDLRSRETTLENYAEMRKLGYSPLFVNHLWLEGGEEIVDKIWEEEDKLCLSGFAATATSEEKFPGHRKEVLQEAMLKGQAKETVVHLLAASSIRRFVKYADRIDSVDSTSWAKAGAFGMFLHLEYAEKNGIMIPTQKVYALPTNRRRITEGKKDRIPNPEVAKKILKEVEKFGGKGVTEYQKWVNYCVDQTRKYVAALNALDPDTIVKAHGEEPAEKVAKGDSREFFFVEWEARDPVEMVSFGGYTGSTEWATLELAELEMARVEISKGIAEQVDGLFAVPPQKHIAEIDRELAFRARKHVGVSKMSSHWRNKNAAAYAARLRVELGESNCPYYYEENKVEWLGVGGLSAIRVRDESIAYDTPYPHSIFVECEMVARVPSETIGAVAAITGAIIFDGLQGIVRAKSDTVTHAAAMLGWVEEITKGQAEATAEEFVRRLEGNVTPFWFPSSMRAIDAPPVAKPAEVTEKRARGDYDVEMLFPISKVDDEKRIVTGIVLEPDEVDSQNDTITPETIEEAAFKFLSGYNHKTKMGVMHQVFGKIGVELIESWVTKEDGKIGDEPVKKGSWVMSVRVTDDNLWQKIKAGAITGFSIGGVATVR